MKQLILPNEYNGEQIFTLSREDSHYLLRVNRKDIGFCFNLLDRDGNEYNGKIIEINNENCVISLDKKVSTNLRTNPIIVFQSIPKGKKIDLMIRQCVEAGVAEIVPIMADHTIPTFTSADEKVKKRDRWEKIIKEAAQQSGTKSITKLSPLLTFKEALNRLEEPYTGIFFHQEPLENETLHKLLNDPKGTIVIVIGPEGGLSKGEIKLLQEYNFKPAILGKNILRAETATVFSLGAVQMILLESDNWTLNKK